jgi:hypothetical protein
LTPAVSFCTVGVNGIALGSLAATVADVGETVTEIGGVTLIVTGKDLVESVIDTAVSVTVKFAAAAPGAVYVMAVPEALVAADIVPQGVGPTPVQVRFGEESIQFTPLPFVSLWTVGVNGIGAGLLAATVIGPGGATVTAIALVSVMIAVAGVAVVAIAVLLSITCRITVAVSATPVPAGGILPGAVYVSVTPFSVSELAMEGMSDPQALAIGHATRLLPGPC